MQPFSFHSLIPDLNDEKGHLYTYHLSLKKVSEKLHLSHFASVPQECTLPLPKGWERHFSLRGPLKKSLNQFLSRWKDYRSLFSKQQQIFFLDSFNALELLLITFLCSKQNVLCLLFRYCPDQLFLKGFLHHSLCKMLQWRLKNHCILLTDSSIVAKEWALPFHVVPIPHSSVITNKASRSKPIKCWWPGEPRLSKGRYLIEKLCHLNDPTISQFHLYASKEFPLSTSSLRLTHLPPVLSINDYNHYLHLCPLIFLPYNPKIYRGSTSGIFVEAICTGSIPLVTSGTWMALELKKHGLEVFIRDWSNPHFFTSLLSLLENTSWMQPLQSMQEAYREYHSIDSMADQLNQILMISKLV